MIKLQKGQKISLTKDNPGLSKIAVGLGWDENKGLGGFFKSNGNIDCDATAFLLRNGRLSSRSNTADEVSYRHKGAEKNCVRHSGDNLTGAGDGDDETIYVDLDNVPEDVDKIVFVVNIYEARNRKQEFGMIKNAFIRLVDEKTNKEICRYDLSENYDGMTAMIFAEVYKKDNEWKFNAVGQGTKDGSISELTRRYK